MGNMLGSLLGCRDCTTVSTAVAAAPVDAVPVHRQDAGGRLVNERYELGEELGRGSFGVVRVATDRRGRVLACKTISVTRLGTRKDIEYVNREVLIMAALPRHPAMVWLHEVYVDEVGVHLVMDLCDGRPLSKWMATRRRRLRTHGASSEQSILPIPQDWEETAAVVARMVVGAVYVLQKEGIMHRDLKPGNLVCCDVDGEGRCWLIKVIDFGLSIFFTSGSDRFSDRVGTIRYMAPEVLEDNPSYGPSADIWSVGVIIYELLAGRRPFPSDGTRKGQRQAIAGTRTSALLSEQPWPHISDSAWSLVLMMLDENPDKRPTARQVLDHPWLNLNGPAAI